MFFAPLLIAALPHMDLEMESHEYRKILEIQAQNKTLVIEQDERIENAIKLGDRLGQWIQVINQNRSEASAIRLSSAATRRGIPIDKPSIYNPVMIEKDTLKILSELPQSMRDVLSNKSAFPTQPPIDDETFIKHARLVDRNYQSAARYKSLIPYKDYFIENARSDVRGLYFLQTNKIGKNELKNVRNIHPKMLPKIQEALIKICQNGEEKMQDCPKLILNATKKNQLAKIYDTYFPIAQQVWDAFFKIPADAIRADIEWNENTMTVPFNTPSIPKFIPYLQDNIEDEFKFKDWGLKMNFGIFEDGPLLKFEPGVVPHVNALGGNEIVMDANQPIEEYESQWTIRHEFGHVLGLPDCYHEFYDVDLDAFVNYQLDITDLMCSRAGNMKERIYQELEGAYNK